MAQTYNNTGVLIPEDKLEEVVSNVREQSFAMRVGRRLRDARSSEQIMSVEDVVATAGWLGASGDSKPTTTSTWRDVILYIGEIAAISVFHEDVLDDVQDNGYDLFGSVQAQMEEAIARSFDAAALTGLGAPSNFPTGGIIGRAINAGNVVTESGVLYQDLLGDDGLFAAVEDDGFDVNGVVGKRNLMSRLRGLTDNTGQPIFQRDLANGQNVQASTNYRLAGAPVLFPKTVNIAGNAAVTGADNGITAVAGDWNEFVYSIRKDLTFTIANTGIVTDSVTGVVHNLFQEDKIALRAVMRAGFALPNPRRLVDGEYIADGFPFAVLQPTDTSAPND